MEALEVREPSQICYLQAKGFVAVTTQCSWVVHPERRETALYLMTSIAAFIDCMHVARACAHRVLLAVKAA